MKRQMDYIRNYRPRPISWLDPLLRPLKRLLLLPNRIIHSSMPESWNPLTQTGAIANLAFVVAVVSGILLLFWYRPTVHEAYTSLQDMDGNFLVHLVRSLHRYSSDACVFLILVHALKYFADGRFGGARWLAWVTGIFSVAVLWSVGWTGYWLVWDDRAKAVALGTARMLDLLPIFADPLSRSFLTDESVNSLLFFLVFFFHMLLPLGIVAGLWLHIQRLNRSHWMTDKWMTLWVVVSLVVLSLVRPAESAPAAHMTEISGSYTMDYWYLVPIYLTDRLGGGLLWALTLGATILITAVPWILIRGKDETAVVKEDRCQDCRQCYVDCPFNAITMVPTNGGRYESVARVDPSNCVSCGICAAACLPLAIGLPSRDVMQDRRRWKELKHARQNEEPFLAAYVCASSVASDLQFDPQTGLCEALPAYRVEPVSCSGWVHARSVESALRDGNSGVLVVGCPPGECSFREGTDWACERFSGNREPELRSDKLPAGAGRIRLIRPESRSELIKEAEGFRKEILFPSEEAANTKTKSCVHVAGFFATPWIMASMVGGVLTWATFSLSDLPYKGPFSGHPELVVSFKHPGSQTENCHKLTPEEKAKLPMHMRKDQMCERKREPVRLRVQLDGKEMLNRSYRPEGIWQDGSSLAIESLPVDSGDHNIVVEIGDSADGKWEYREEKTMTFENWKRNVLLFDRSRGFTWNK